MEFSISLNGSKKSKKILLKIILCIVNNNLINIELKFTFSNVKFFMGRGNNEIDLVKNVVVLLQFFHIFLENCLEIINIYLLKFQIDTKTCFLRLIWFDDHSIASGRKRVHRHKKIINQGKTNIFPISIKIFNNLQRNKKYILFEKKKLCYQNYGLRKCLKFPDTRESLMFYKQKLQVRNLTIHNRCNKLVTFMCDMNIKTEMLQTSSHHVVFLIL